jgi:hypothetical protein
MNILYNSLKSGGTKDHIRRVKVPGTAFVYINVKEYRRGHQKWAIQRKRQHRVRCIRRRQTKQKHNTIDPKKCNCYQN